MTSCSSGALRSASAAARAMWDGPQVLVLHVDQAPRPLQRLQVAASDRPLTVRGERVGRSAGRVGAKHLHGVRTPGRRVGTLRRQRLPASTPSTQPEQPGQDPTPGRSRVLPAFPQDEVEVADRRPTDL